jgi:phosphoserine aminotransferase
MNKMARVYNFGAGPSMLPLPVLKQAQQELLDYHGSGMSVMEISHRSALYEEINTKAQENIKTLLGIDDNWAVLFLGGGGSLQFSMLAMNFLTPGKVGAYADTGNFAHKAMVEAAKEGEVAIAYSSKETGYDRVPKPNEIQMPPQAAYLYITSNNTVYGTEYREYPDTGWVPLIADCSSDLLAKPLPMEKFSLIYGGAQKNIGPAGVTVVIAKKSFLRGRDANLPSMLNYENIMDHDSMYNTPPCFNVYIVELVTEWLLSRGGLESLQIANERKARIVYNVIDTYPEFYRGRAQKDSRSMMNATFTLPSKELEAQFLAEAGEAGMVGLKGHRVVGGIRASMYNAMPQEGCERLAAFMEDFYHKNA